MNGCLKKEKEKRQYDAYTSDSQLHRRLSSLPNSIWRRISETESSNFAAMASRDARSASRVALCLSVEGGEGEVRVVNGCYEWGFQC